MNIFELGNDKRVSRLTRRIREFYKVSGPLEYYLAGTVARCMCDVREIRKMREMLYKEATWHKTSACAATLKDSVKIPALLQRMEADINKAAALLEDPNDQGLVLTNVVEHVDLKKMLAFDKHEANLSREMYLAIKQLLACKDRG